MMRQDLSLGKYGGILGLVVLTNVLLLWMKPRTRQDCNSFQPRVLARACLAELSAAKLSFSSVVTPPATPPLSVTIARVDFIGVKLEPVTSGRTTHYVLSGILINESSVDLMNIRLTVNYYNFGDNPDNIAPFAHYELKIKGPLSPGQSDLVRETVSDGDINFPATSFSWNWKISGAQASE